MFETGRVESGTLRIDAPNRDALKTLQADLKGNSPLRLATLLSTDAKEFLAEDDSQRHYACSWGLAYCLTFRLGVLGDKALDRYVAPEHPESPVDRFEKLVDMPFDEFERRWRQYILGLR